MTSRAHPTTRATTKRGACFGRRTDQTASAPIFVSSRTYSTLRGTKRFGRRTTLRLRICGNLLGPDAVFALSIVESYRPGGSPSDRLSQVPLASRRFLGQQ